MNDKMTPDKERENCPCRKAIINPFDAMMMVVVRRLDKAYLELKRSKPPAKEAEFALRNAKLSFYGELVRQSIETVFSPEEIIALYENDDLAGGAWTVWNDIGCPVDGKVYKLKRESALLGLILCYFSKNGNYKDLILYYGCVLQKLILLY